jgi:hypothetical protein
VETTKSVLLEVRKEEEEALGGSPIPYRKSSSGQTI